ncbi:hypothetical protein MY04_0211 [Flammeovirga sp. MY04]|uniref:hypothetical protein n=1 Tax=Flammeovirga sp. MY04 TaxID=1191459 RepID=UPI0008063359|nr:hypothetical protein [Flammeovirga sp. MY04]ANQ47593.1 hypothetical protein MY04_0211 [Flammeovirga sp. MY04]
MRRTFILLFLVVLFCSCSENEEVDTTLHFESSKGVNEVEMTDSLDEKIIEFTKVADIGKGVIRRPQGSVWPEHIILRLPFTRLEGFKGYTDLDKTHLFERFYSSGRTQNQYISTYKDILVKKIAKPSDYTEVELPKEMFDENPRVVYIEWVNVYRN